MYDNESKIGIKIYTVVFLIILTGFIGFLVSKGFDDKNFNNSNVKKTSHVKVVR